MKAFNHCRHCREVIGIARVGRGLCRKCWDDKAIRSMYPPVATFGGNVMEQIRRFKEKL